jgi:hypothetical protein
MNAGRLGGPRLLRRLLVRKPPSLRTLFSLRVFLAPF